MEESGAGGSGKGGGSDENLAEAVHAASCLARRTSLPYRELTPLPFGDMKRIDRREIEGFTRRLCEEHGLAPWQVRCYQRPAYEPYDPVKEGAKEGAKGGKDPNIYIQHGGALEPIHEVSQLVKSVSGALFCRVYFNPAEGLGAADEEALRLRVKEFYEAHRHGGG